MSSKSARNVLIVIGILALIAIAILFYGNRQKKYSCNSSTFQCEEDSNGLFANIQSCSASCIRPPPPPSPQKYSCDKGVCAEDVNGAYDSFADCSSACVVPPPPPPPPQKYSCNKGVCALDVNGTYDSFADCSSACVVPPPPPPPPAQKYSCNKGVCALDVNGAYDSFADCSATCIKPSTYSCVNSECQWDVNGAYNSLSSCKSACIAPAKKYSCNNGVCQVDVNGGFSSLSQCTAACVKPQKYSCVSGSCQTDENGAYTNLDDCNKNCSLRYSCVSGSCQEDSEGVYVSMTDCQKSCTAVRYSCKGGKCVQDANGTYASQSDCSDSCPKYSCNKGNCIVDDNGAYQTITDCRINCFAPLPANRYGCSSGICSEVPPNTPNTFDSMSDCQKTCSVPKNYVTLEVNGNDADASLNPDTSSFGTLQGALSYVASSSSRKIIKINAGTYTSENISGTVYTIPDNVSLIGASASQVTIQILNVSNPTFLVVMGNNTSITGVTLLLSTDTTSNPNVIGVLFPSGTSDSSVIDSSKIVVQNNGESGYGIGIACLQSGNYDSHKMNLTNSVVEVDVLNTTSTAQGISCQGMAGFYLKNSVINCFLPSKVATQTALYVSENGRIFYDSESVFNTGIAQSNGGRAILVQ